MRKRRIRKRRRIIISISAIVVFLCILIYSLINILSWEKDVSNNNKIKHEIKKLVVVTVDDEAKRPKYNIDWMKLKEQNNDTVAYLKVNNTNIDYVVVKTNDNNYYLKHNFNKEYNIAGWIFADYHNRFDGTDKNIIIYGHNTKDNSMFGSLKNILDESWYNNKENLIIDLVTENGLSEYQVFSVYTIPAEDYYISTSFNGSLDYLNFLNTLKNRSIKNFDVELTENDRILTLSSCTTGGKGRVVLHAKI